MSFQKPREIAFRVLQQRETGANYTEEILDQHLEQQQISAPDRGLVQELTYGAVRWQMPLDWLIDRRTDTRPQKPALRILLRLGLYQVFWLDRIPDHAAVHETVELAKQVGFGSQTGFLNAVLRGYIREKDETRQALEQLKRERPDVALSHPAWLFDRWKQRWGLETAIRLMEWNNSPAKPFARVNSLKIDPGTLLALWREKENVEYDFFRRDWTGENLVFEMKAGPSPGQLASFRNGYFYLQDPSTLLAVRELDPKPGETVLDLCAAPGGKATFIAQLMNNEGRVVAFDIQADRRELLRQNCERAGATCVEIAGSWPQTSGNRPGFDRVLVDAPCSNTGVMRRRIDLRWRIRPEELDRLRDIQLDLLETAAARVKRGGMLVYSTCSLEPEENSDVVREFLKTHSNFRLLMDRALLPFNDGVDGAYVARLAAG